MFLQESLASQTQEMDSFTTELLLKWVSDMVHLEEQMY